MDKNLRGLHITTSLVTLILWIAFFVFTDTSLRLTLPLQYKVVIVVAAATLLVLLPVSIVCLVKSKGSYVFGWLALVGCFIMLLASAVSIFVITSFCKNC